MTAGERSGTGRDSGRARVLETAYRLFSQHGTRAVGVDRIIAESGVAKMTLYRNFASKDELILAFLELREERWTRAWLQATVEGRAQTPAQRLLAIFDVFGEWFARDDFEGCSFINVMLELDDPATRCARERAPALAEIRGFIGGLAQEAGVEDAGRLRAPVAHPHEGLRSWRPPRAIARPARGRASSARCCCPTTESRPGGAERRFSPLQGGRTDVRPPAGIARS